MCCVYFRIHQGKYYIQKLFGSKFHRNFPKIPAPCELPSCGCGELNKDRKGRLGLHLNFKPKIKVCFIICYTSQSNNVIYKSLIMLYIRMQEEFEDTKRGNHRP